MPIINPKANMLMEKLSTKPKPKNEQGEVVDILNGEGFSLEETIRNMKILSEVSDSDSVKHSIFQTSLKLHGVLKDTPIPNAPVNIIINDPEMANRQNPIMLPRTLKQNEDLIN